MGDCEYTNFGDLCEKYDVPIFDRQELFSLWQRNPWAAEFEAKASYRAARKGEGFRGFSTWKDKW